MLCPIPEGQKGRRIQKLHPFCICENLKMSKKPRDHPRYTSVPPNLIVIGMMGCPLPKITGAYSHFVAWIPVKSWILAVHPCSLFPLFFSPEITGKTSEIQEIPRSSRAEASAVPVSLLDLLAVLRHFLHHERAKHPLPLTAREVTRLPMLWGYAASDWGIYDGNH